MTPGRRLAVLVSVSVGLLILVVVFLALFPDSGPARIYRDF